MSDLSRRAFVGGLLAAAATACSNGGDGDSDGDGDGSTPTTTDAAPPATTLGALPPDLAAVDLPSTPFTLGVASGDPDDTSVVLWTRLALDPLAADGGLPVAVPAVVVDVATDEAFERAVSSGRFPVDATGANSVHAVVGGLQPASDYWYRFRVGAWTSPVGRTRTVPAPADERAVALAVASCQRYGDGHWAAHRDIAEADVDLVLFVGDYVYEAETDARVRALPGGLAAEAVTLDDYRQRYAAARLDPHLAAAHAAHPWAVTWDDHEVDNDYVGTTVDTARRDAAYRAWWEHQATRLPAPGGALAVHRRLRLGATVDLLLLDTRQHRSAPPCGGGVVEATSCRELGREGDTMLGAEQEAWLADELVTVDGAAGRARWTAVAQSVVMTEVAVLGRINVDAWDGYPAARRRLLEALAPVGNAVVLTGDVHIQLVGDIGEPGDAGLPVAAELVAPSISSRAPEAYADATPLLAALVPSVRHAADRRGWLRCDVDRSAWRATYREVADVTDPASSVVDGPAFVVADGVPGAVPA